MFTKYIKIRNWSHAQIKNMFASIKISNWSYAQFKIMFASIEKIYINYAKIIFLASFASHGVLFVSCGLAGWS
jgi:hypothetical protein